MMFYGPPGTYERGGPLKLGDAVLYQPSPGHYFQGFVDSRPFLCGVTQCVTLCDMAREYAKFKGSLSADPTMVKAAAVNACWVKQ